MTKSKLRKIAVVLSALAVLSGGCGIDTAYAGDGGGFGGSGFGGGQIAGFGEDHIGGEFGGGLMGGGATANLRGNPLGTEPIGPRIDNHVGALADVYAAPFDQLRHSRTPVVVWGAVPWGSGSDVPPWYGGSAPPWYGGSDVPPWYGSGLTWYGGVENPTYAVPGRNPSDTTNRNATCRTQSYQVRSAEDGGERAVNIVHC